MPGYLWNKSPYINFTFEERDIDKCSILNLILKWMSADLVLGFVAIMAKERGKIPSISHSVSPSYTNTRAYAYKDRLSNTYAYL